MALIATCLPAVAEDEPSPYEGQGPHFVFTGQMDYAPNEDAVVRFAQKILPLIRANLPPRSFILWAVRPHLR